MFLFGSRLFVLRFSCGGEIFIYRVKVEEIRRGSRWHRVMAWHVMRFAEHTEGTCLLTLGVHLVEGAVCDRGFPNKPKLRAAEIGAVLRRTECITTRGDGLIE
jgi:hypothetical protein